MSINKTIDKTSVTVCAQSPRQQAISDLLTSAAFTETALSHILNTAGEKI